MTKDTQPNLIVYRITQHGFIGGRSFGLTIAAFGFLSASIGGVIHLNILRKKGHAYQWEYEDEKAEKLNGDDIQHPDEIPMNGSMDKLTSQLMLVFVAYLMAYGMVTGTASTGIILLRQLDPEFKTPVQDNMVYLNFPAIAFGFPMMLIAAVAPEAPLRTFFIVIGLFAVMNVILFRKFIFVRKSKVRS